MQRSHTKRYSRAQLTKHQCQNLEEPSSPLEEEDDYPEAWRELPHHRRHPKRGYGRRDLLSLRLYRCPRHACASSKHAMFREQQTMIPLEPRQIHAQDIHLLRVEADSSEQCHEPKQKTSYQSTILSRKSFKSQINPVKSRRCIPRCGGATC
jgi:hypothetical protein